MEPDPETQADPDHGGYRPMRKRASSGVAILILLIAGALLVIPRLGFKPAATPEKRETAVPTDPAPMEAAPSLGPKTAAVTIIEYADFGCPACWYWYEVGGFDKLRARYGDQVRFVWRDYPVITLLSPKAAEAGQCANEQGKFWEFHDAVYGNGGAIKAGDLESYATRIGLNMSQFDDCVSSRRYRDRVNAEQQEAFDHGFNGAPFFLVGKQLVIGPQAIPVFEALIDPLLAVRK